MRTSIRSIAAIVVAVVGFASGDALLSRRFKIVVVDPVTSAHVERIVLPAQNDATCDPQEALGSTRRLSGSIAEMHSLIHRNLCLLRETPKADKQREDELITSLLAVLTDDNAAAIFQTLTDEDQNTPFGLAALERWTKIDATAAMEWALARREIPDEQAWALARGLIDDPAALELCNRLPNTRWAQALLRNAAVELVWTDPVEAIRLARLLHPGDEQAEVLRAAAYSWTMSDASAASRWIERVADQPLRDKLVCSAAEARAATDPLSAVEWLLSATSVGSHIQVTNTIQTIVALWVECKPAEVAELVAKFPPGDTRSACVALVARRWPQLDPSAASAWIKAVPDAQSFSGSNNY